MSDAQAERGIQQLYQETSIRDELIDEEAEMLLQWGSDQVKRLAAQGLDDAAFDEQYSEMVRLLTRMSRFAARRQNLSPDEAQTSMERIDTSAQAVGLQPGGFIAQTAPDDIKGNLQALMTYVSADAAASSAVAAATPTEDVPADPYTDFAQDVETLPAVPTPAAATPTEDVPADPYTDFVQNTEAPSAASDSAEPAESPFRKWLSSLLQSNLDAQQDDMNDEETQQ